MHTCISVSVFVGRIAIAIGPVFEIVVGRLLEMRAITHWQQVRLPSVERLLQPDAVSPW
jgi:hypothetical protein